MAFRSAKNYMLVRMHTPDGEVRFQIETDKANPPDLAELRRQLQKAMDMIDRFEGKRWT